MCNVFKALRNWGIWKCISTMFFWMIEAGLLQFFLMKDFFKSFSPCPYFAYFVSSGFDFLTAWLMKEMLFGSQFTSQISEPSTSTWTQNRSAVYCWNQSALVTAMSLNHKATLKRKKMKRCFHSHSLLSRMGLNDLLIILTRSWNKLTHVLCVNPNHEWNIGEIKVTGNCDIKMGSLVFRKIS